MIFEQIRETHSVLSHANFLQWSDLLLLIFCLRKKKENGTNFVNFNSIFGILKVHCFFSWSFATPSYLSFAQSLYKIDLVLSQIKLWLKSDNFSVVFCKKFFLRLLSHFSTLYSWKARNNLHFAMA